MSDRATLFTCADPPSATPFLRRLRARQRMQLIFLLGVGALTIFICAARDNSENIGILTHLVLGLGAFSLVFCLAIALFMRFSIQKVHTFTGHGADIYIGGIFIARESVTVKKVKMLQIRPVSYGGAHFFLLSIICNHIDSPRYGGVFPIYFCVETADAPQVIAWARERSIETKEESCITTPAKLPLFVR